MGRRTVYRGAPALAVMGRRRHKEGSGAPAAVCDLENKSAPAVRGRESDINGAGNATQSRRFVTFYFTNFPSYLSNFILTERFRGLWYVRRSGSSS